jgi:hypothetical protein
MENQGVNLETNLPNHYFSHCVTSRFALDTYSANPIYTMFPDSARELLSFWAYWSSKEETNNYLQKLFENNFSNSIEFLKCYIPTVWSMGMEPPYRVGLPFKGDIDRHSYDAIISVSR